MRMQRTVTKADVISEWRFHVISYYPVKFYVHRACGIRQKKDLSGEIFFVNAARILLTFYVSFLLLRGGEYFTLVLFQL